MSTDTYVRVHVSCVDYLDRPAPAHDRVDLTRMWAAARSGEIVAIYVNDGDHDANAEPGLSRGAKRPGTC
jgi:hypothetical protein